MNRKFKNGLLIFGTVLVLAVCYVGIVSKGYDSKENKQIKQSDIRMESYPFETIPT